MTAERRLILARLASRPEEEIDFSDIPPLPGEFWESAVRNPFYQTPKQPVTLRVDADVAAWLRRLGKGSQSRVNHLLREAMLRDGEDEVQA